MQYKSFTNVGIKICGSFSLPIYPSLGSRGDNFDPLTYKWVDSGYVLSLTGKKNFRKQIESVEYEENTMPYSVLISKRLAIAVF